LSKADLSKTRGKKKKPEMNLRKSTREKGGGCQTFMGGDPRRVPPKGVKKN